MQLRISISTEADEFSPEDFIETSNLRADLIKWLHGSHYLIYQPADTTNSLELMIES